MKQSELVAKIARLEAELESIKSGKKIAPAMGFAKPAPVVDAAKLARHEATKKLAAWAEKNNHPRIAHQAAFAVSKGGYMGESAFTWAKNHGFKG